MVERTDPARAGVKAGRVVGLLTAGLAVASLLGARATFYESVRSALDASGLHVGIPLWVLFWGNALVAASVRYGAGYVVGSLVGVVYDWLDHPSLPVLVGLVLAVGVVDGLIAGLDARSPLVGAGYLVAWLCYVPVFEWAFDPDRGEDRSGPRPLGEA